MVLFIKVSFVVCLAGINRDKGKREDRDVNQISVWVAILCLRKGKRNKKMREREEGGECVNIHGQAPHSQKQSLLSLTARHSPK